MTRYFICYLSIFLFCSEASAHDERPELNLEDYSTTMTEASWDWQPGDLIFQNDVNETDDIFKRAFGLQWASVGILRPSSGGPRVVFVDEKTGVTEEMLDTYIEGRSSDEYAVYRPIHLNPDYNPSTDVMTAGPLAKFAVSIAYGAPQDTQLLFANGSFYGAELAYESALNAGIVLGSPIRLINLIGSMPDIDPQFRQLLEAHRYCEYEVSFESCWEGQVQNLSIVTTDSLISSGELTQVYP